MKEYLAPSIELIGIKEDVATTSASPTGVFEFSKDDPWNF